MCAKYLTYLSYLKLILIMILVSGTSYAQVIQAGLKGGVNMSWIRSDDSGFREETTISPVLGFNGGIVAAFKMKKRFFLHTELLYSTKGMHIKGPMGLSDKMTYQYIELPLIYNVHFKGELKLKTARAFKWYAGIGPNFSYWLGGKGTIANDELREYDVDQLDYKIVFGERPVEDAGRTDLVYYEDVKRMQVGVNIGAGILLEPANGRKVMVDLRFELGHTWLGKPESADYVFPATFYNNLKARNMGLRFSVMYLLESNLDKKVRNKGKSVVKEKGKTLKRR